MEATLSHGCKRISNGRHSVLGGVLLANGCRQTGMSPGSHEFSRRGAGHGHHGQPGVPEVVETKVWSSDGIPCLGPLPVEVRGVIFNVASYDPQSYPNSRVYAIYWKKGSFIGFVVVAGPPSDTRIGPGWAELLAGRAAARV